MDKEQIEVNEQGGKQSHIGTCFTCVPVDSMERVAKTLEHGRKKYGKENWKLIPYEDHIEHALRHIYKALEGGSSDEDDLSHATARLLFAMHLQDPSEYDRYVDETVARKKMFDQICTTNGWWGEDNVMLRNMLQLSLLDGMEWIYDSKNRKYFNSGRRLTSSR